MKRLEILPPDAETAALSTTQLLAHLNDESYYLRGRVIAGLGRRLQESSEVFTAVLTATQDPTNRQTPFFGFIMVSWLGVIAILENGSDLQKNVLKQLLENWPKQELEDLRVYLADTELPLKEFLPQ
ncbi:hypothetical protein [Hymenobacter sp.]|uniref:hypothetical protein n=1 Tax=Hymenobacter sp. TaxID=1898978 RepID=UPI00286D53CA|nr:hypothetical protein [Hymenobacter sp.]